MSEEKPKTKDFCEALVRAAQRIEAEQQLWEPWNSDIAEGMRHANKILREEYSGTLDATKFSSNS